MNVEGRQYCLAYSFNRWIADSLFLIIKLSRGTDPLTYQKEAIISIILFTIVIRQVAYRSPIYGGWRLAIRFFWGLYASQHSFTALL